jgi:hypothetical protein
MPPEQPPRKLPELGFAGFEASSAAAGRPRRKATWSLRPVHDPSEGAAVDAGRFVTETELYAGIGRKLGTKRMTPATKLQRQRYPPGY